jgi:hypothetical protein
LYATQRLSERTIHQGSHKAIETDRPYCYSSVISHI